MLIYPLNPFIPWPLYASVLTESWRCFSCPGISVTLTPSSNPLAVVHIYAHGPGKSLRNRLRVPLPHAAESLAPDPFSLWVSRPEKRFRSGNRTMDHDYILEQLLSISKSSTPDFVWLHRLHSALVGCPSIFSLETLFSINQLHTYLQVRSIHYTFGLSIHYDNSPTWLWMTQSHDLFSIVCNVGGMSYYQWAPPCKGISYSQPWPAEECQHRTSR